MDKQQVKNLKLLIVLFENLDKEIGISQDTKNDLYRAIADKMQMIQEEHEEELIRKSKINGSRFNE